MIRFLESIILVFLLFLFCHNVNNLRVKVITKIMFMSRLRTSFLFKGRVNVGNDVKTLRKETCVIIN